MLVIDDGSDDEDTLKAFDMISALERVQVHHLPPRGVASALNSGLELASGELILPLGSDDKMHPQYARKAADFFQTRKDVRIVTCIVTMFGAIEGRFSPDFSIGRMLRQSIISGASMFRRDQALEIGGFNPELTNGEDWEFFLRLLAEAGDAEAAAVQIPEPLYFYRKHSASITARPDRREAVAKSEIAALRGALPLYAKYAPEYLAWLCQQEDLLNHFRHRYGRVEDLLHLLASQARRFRKSR